jgi:hypothetical protein
LSLSLPWIAKFHTSTFSAFNNIYIFPSQLATVQTI